MEKVKMDKVTKDKLMENLLTLRKRSYKIKFDLEGSDYEPIENIGSGAYGVVCSALNRKTKEKVAIKKIPSIFDHPDIAKRTYREVKIIKHFKHDNIIAIHEILKPMSNDFRDIYIVFEFMESDLHHVIHSQQPLTEDHVRFFIYQILRGLKYIHSANVIHRDLKPSNLLVNGNCELKIGDFGMARGFLSTPDQRDITLTTYVATRWYRAPELILPVVEYSAAVDLWSVGCIFAEMLGRKQLFPGLNQRDQLDRIVSILGPPSDDYLSIVLNPVRFHDMVQSWKPHKPVAFKSLYPNASKKAVDLLSKMLIFDPRERISAEKALAHLFVNKYHDPYDEPVCIPVFNFDFEQKKLKNAELKAEIMKEVMDYHKPKPVFDLASFNLKPVSKEELNKPFVINEPKSSEEHPRPPASIMRNAANMNSKVCSEKSLKGSNIIVATDAAVSESDIEMLSARSAKLTISGQESEVSQPSQLTVPSQPDIGTDVVMLSAKSEPGESVDMKSANKELWQTQQPQQQQTLLDMHPDVTEVKTEVKVEPAESKKPLDTKALIKEAILKAGLRKQQFGDQQKPKPVTAYQKQKEREEKRKQKRDKAKERKKKKDHKDVLGPEQVLTEADRSMLERWKNMHNKTAPFVHPISKLLPKKSDITVASQAAGQSLVLSGQEKNQPSQNAAFLSVYDEHSIPEPIGIGLSCFTDSPENSQDSIEAAIGQAPTVALSQSQVTPVTSLLSTKRPTGRLTISSSSQNLAPGNAMEPSHESVQERGHSGLTPDLDQLADTTPLPFAQYTSLSPTELLGMSIDKNDAETSQTVTTSQLVSQVTEATSMYTTGHSIGQGHDQTGVTSVGGDLHQDVGYMINTSIQLDNTARNDKMVPTNVELDREDHHAIIRDPVNTHQSLPSYHDAVSSRLNATVKLHESAQIPNTLGNFDNSLQNPSHFDTSASSQTLNMVMPSVDTEDGTSGENATLLNPDLGSAHFASNWLNTLTNQMSRSHVEDLTLPRTPKGAGGGYGVGLDIDAIINEMMTDSKLTEKDSAGPDSGQPLSASVFSDWFDPNDLEALKQELKMGSPLTFSDITS